MQRNIYGLDVGYSYTKDHHANIFQSAYTVKPIFGKKPIYIDGTEYYVGNGTMSGEADKTESYLNKICTIYALLRSGYTKDLDITVGLPVSQYDTQKNKLRESIYSYSKSDIGYCGTNYKLSILNVNVLPQGVASIYSAKEVDKKGKYIIVDFGGLTICIMLCEIDGHNIEILKQDTLFKGIRTFYSDITTAVNNRYSLKLDTSYAEDIMRNGLRIHGKEQDISFLKEITKEYVNNILDFVCLSYPVETYPVRLCGGGSILLGNQFCKRVPDTKTYANPQFSNANGYFNYGYLKFTNGGS